jgi:FtsP/CotA-like multicopper oxidase with cupredoxin domain
MHNHGGPFQVVAVDGETLQPPAHYQADTVNVGTDQCYDVIWTACELERKLGAGAADS